MFRAGVWARVGAHRPIFGILLGSPSTGRERTRAARSASGSGNVFVKVPGVIGVSRGGRVVPMVLEGRFDLFLGRQG